MSHRNNFDLLRFLFAFMVVLSHSHWLSGEAALEPLSRIVSTRLAVKGFFIVSGYLVFMSYDRSRSLRDYAEKRVRRIYPAYAAVIAACAILGGVLTVLPLSDYLAPALIRYLGANLAFMNTLAPTLPGVFEGNSTAQVNPALWTLKIEAMFYVAVPLLAWVGARAGRLRTMLATYLLSAAYVVLLGHLAMKSGSAALEQMQRQLPGQLAYFVTGALGYYYAPVLERRWPALVAASVLALGALQVYPSEIARALLEPAAMGVVVLWAAVGLPCLGNFGRFGDFSYGIYIIHCPTIQTLVALGLFRRSPWGGFALAVSIVAVLAVLCWHLIEKPFLRKTSHYRQAGATTALETAN